MARRRKNISRGISRCGCAGNKKTDNLITEQKTEYEMQNELTRRGRPANDAFGIGGMQQSLPFLAPQFLRKHIGRGQKGACHKEPKGIDKSKLRPIYTKQIL
jgi:hypothetical protein